MGFSEEDLEAARAASSMHWHAVKKAEYAACFNCVEFFYTRRIREWADDGNTALCPICGVDAVIPQVDGQIQLSPPLIRELNRRHFDGQC